MWNKRQYFTDSIILTAESYKRDYSKYQLTDQPLATEYVY